MKLIIGLGNPGEKYETTRHNIGFMVLEQFLKDFESAKDSVWTDSKKFKSDIAEITWQPKRGIEEKVILVKPKTYMNDSGLATKILVDFYKVNPEDVWILHDDVDFPLGSLKIKLGGASAGHRGIMSIIETLGTDAFYRFRLGIGRPGEGAHNEVSHYVLDSFSHEDHGKLRELLKRCSKALQMALEEGIDRAMNRFNTK